MYWFYIWAFTGLTALLFFVLLLPLYKQQNRSGKNWLIGLVFVISLLSVLIYQQQGAIDEIQLLEDMQAVAMNPSTSVESLNSGLLGQLESFVEKNPDDEEYWYLLGEMRMDVQDFQGALDAFQQASSLRPEDTTLYSRMAEARFFLDEYALSQEVRNYIDVVLADNPNDTTVLGILGISAYRAQQFEAAVRFWGRALQNMPPNSPAAQSLRNSIEQAEIAGGLIAGNGDEGLNPSNGQTSLELEVSLGEGIDYAPNDVVFVFARQYGGSPMPLAALRMMAGSLPSRVTMDDSNLMVQGRSLGDFEQLELVARLSYSGTPNAQSGDYQVLVGPVTPSDIDEPISLTIDELIE